MNHIEKSSNSKAMVSFFFIFSLSNLSTVQFIGQIVNQITIADTQKLGLESQGTVILQVIIVASGLLTFTVTFGERLEKFGEKASISWLMLTWMFLVVSIVVGFIALDLHTGFLLGYTSGAVKNLTILNWITLQFILFTFAIISIFIYALISIGIMQRIKKIIKKIINNKKKFPENTNIT